MREESNLLLNATQIYNTFGVFRDHLALTREFTRRTVNHGQELDHTQLKHVRPGRSFGLLQQLLAFITSNPKVSVIARNSGKKEDTRTAFIERWLSGVPDAVNLRQEDYVQDGNAHLIESGLMAYYVQFNAQLAAMGEFPIEVLPIDPLNFAYRRSNLGIISCVLSETRPADAVYSELEGWYEATPRRNRKWELPASLKAAVDSNDPTQEIQVLRYWDKQNETMWVNDEHVWTRPHWMGGKNGRLPFAIGAWGVPSLLPEERHIGFIYPVTDDLMNLDFLLNLYDRYAETQLQPLAASVDEAGNKTTFVKIRPGDVVEGKAVPIPFNADPRLMELMASKLEVDVSDVTAPRIVTSGDSGGASSGYQVTSQTSGFQARMDLLLKVPERVHGQLYSLILSTVEWFADESRAKLLASEAVEDYMRSFSVTVPVDGQGKGKSQLSEVPITAVDIDGHTRVKVTMKPNLPNDRMAKAQRVQLYSSIGWDKEWIARNIEEVEDMEEWMQLNELDELRKGNPEFDKFWNDYQIKQYILSHKDVKEEYLKYWEAQGVVLDPKTLDVVEEPLPTEPAPPELNVPLPPPPGGEMPQGMPPQGMPQGLPSELAALTGMAPSINPLLQGQAPETNPIPLG